MTSSAPGAVFPSVQFRESPSRSRCDIHHPARHRPRLCPPRTRNTALYQVFQRHLPSFERMWADSDTGNCLPKHVTQELQKFLTCGILSHGFAQMHCDACHKRHLVAFSCKGRGFCPSCMGRRMNEGAANLVDHVLPEQVPIRQWVLNLGNVLRLITDTVSAWYCRHHPGSKTGSVTVIQRASSDLRLNPHFHTLFLDGVYVLSQNPEAAVAAPFTPIFHPAPKPTQADIECATAETGNPALENRNGRIPRGPLPSSRPSGWARVARRKCLSSSGGSTRKASATSGRRRMGILT